MKKNYIFPQMTIHRIGAEQIIAASDKLERGTGSGGNNAEVKEEYFSTDNPFPVEWDE